VLITPVNTLFYEVQTYAVFRENLRRLRLELGLTQQDFSEKAQLSYKYYQDLEAGRLPGLTLATIDKLAQTLGVDVWTLFHPDIIPNPTFKRARAPKIEH
jgi:transcriptional regulator with XRE-family HTH domain